MENLNLIRKIAWSFHNSTGIDYDDLFQEAYIAYHKAMKTYDPALGKISTHLWHHVSKHLTNYYKEERKQTSPVRSIEKTPSVYSITTEEPTFWENLTNEAQGIVETIFETPQLFISMNRENVKSSIVPIMRKKGWKLNKTVLGIENIRAICQ